MCSRVYLCREKIEGNAADEPLLPKPQDVLLIASGSATVEGWSRREKMSVPSKHQDLALRFDSAAMKRQIFLEHADEVLPLQ